MYGLDSKALKSLSLSHDQSIHACQRRWSSYNNSHVLSFTQPADCCWPAGQWYVYEDGIDRSNTQFA